METAGKVAHELSIEQRIARNEALRGLLDRLERHAPGEGPHASRVAVYAVATGESLGMRGDELLTLRYAATLHDIGKLRVPARMLLSDEPLTEADRQIANSHVLAREYLQRYEFLEPAIPLIEAHHERWDGRGYPNAWHGEEIPLGARIIAAGEVFDVLLHGAPWRPKFPEEAAIAAMRGLSGSWFEPKVVEALLSVHPLIQPGTN